MSMTLSDMIKELFAVQTRGELHTVTISNTLPNTLVAPNNPNRLSLIISNSSVRNVYLHYDLEFILGEGILLVPSGGFISFLWSEDFDVVGWAMYGLAETAPADLNVLEIIST